MTWGYIGGAVVGSVVSGVMSSDTSGKNISATERSEARARADQAPWREKGEAASNELWNLMQGKTDISEKLRMDPSYRFRLAEGEQGQFAQQKATGMRLSGRALKGMERYRQGLASEESANYMNRLERISGRGQAAASGQAATTMGAAQDINRARTAGAVGVNQAVQGGISNYLAMQQQNKMLEALSAQPKSNLQGPTHLGYN